MQPNAAGADDRRGQNIEALRRDLPNVKKRHYPDVAVLKQPMDPARVLAALDERGAADEPPLPAAEAADAPTGNP